MKILPDAYYKDIYSINYDKIRESGIDNLIFDLDNTLIAYDKSEIDEKTKKLLKKLKKDFTIIVITNQSKKKTKDLQNNLNIRVFTFAAKPFKNIYKRLSKEINLNASIFIGDQVATDILGAKRVNAKAILIDGFRESGPFYTLIYKIIRNIIVDKRLEKGKYYDNIEK